MCVAVRYPISIALNNSSEVLNFCLGSEVIYSACNAGDLGSIPGLGRSPGEGNGNPLQCSCLEKESHGQRSHGIAKSQTGLSNLTNFNLGKVEQDGISMTGSLFYFHWLRNVGFITF